MSDQFIGEIRAFGFNFAPVYWAFCNGQLMSIAQYTALYSLVGTTYGGDGQSTFGLPNLKGRSPMHWGTSPGFNTDWGQPMGTTTVTLTAGQVPAHFHTISAAVTEKGGGAERSDTPTAASYLSRSSGTLGYQPAPATPNTPFASAAISSTGGSQAHENMQPYMTLNFCVALEGVYPSRG